MTGRFKAVLCDLDGTLADTLADLAGATNHALAALGCPTHPVHAYRYFVGDGAKNLLRRTLPAAKQSLADEGVRLMKQHYDEHCFDETKLYPGITALISAVAGRGLKLAVLSNKPDDFTKRMVAHFFAVESEFRGNAGGASARRPAQESGNVGALRRLPPSSTLSIGPFEAVHGQKPGVPLKPDPAAALEIARELGIPPAQWLYLGDTNTDMKTARAAGMCAVGVLWGFRDRKELEESGAQHIIASPGELLGLAGWA